MLGGILSRFIILKVTEIQTTKLTSVKFREIKFCLGFIIFRME